MSEKCDKKVKIVIHVEDEAFCEFAGKDLREVIDLINVSVQQISKLEEAIGDFLYKYKVITREKYKYF